MVFKIIRFVTHLAVQELDWRLTDPDGKLIDRAVLKIKDWHILTKTQAIKQVWDKHARKIGRKRNRR